MGKTSYTSAALALLLTAMLAAGCAAGGGAPSDARQQVVHVFSARHYGIDRELYDAFERESGLRVVETKGTAEELIARLREEGAAAGADLLIAVDGGVLVDAGEAGVLQPIDSPLLERQVPGRLRDADSGWIGLTTRARIIVYAADRVEEGAIAGYADLADPRWRGKVLARSSTSLYNESLLASFIAGQGADRAAAWAEGVASNLARPPEGGDRSQALAVYRGEGDVAIMNTYYLGQMLASGDSEEARAAALLGIVFPDQDSGGTHVNISGAGLVRDAPNAEGAIRLLEFLTAPEAQAQLSGGSMEYPVHPEAELPELLAEWGEFDAQPFDARALSRYRQLAAELFARADWP
ncbi:extracellular solute-binding protein [Paenibacillus sp. IB182496]|uniref:Extracellular solute-binding protein n=1 Tax=Paenibacillus sabuli TaxID=2772509 RepID=A0A927BPN6_9BACL|nr:extracellular solute-binding protein [Paenibacillus sabuli]MBD2843967.1 extracellular solute-binding protein [Paenibacillus sabuli]